MTSTFSVETALPTVDVDLLSLSKTASTPLPVVTPLTDPFSLITPARKLSTFTRSEVAFLISRGHILIVHRRYIYRMNHFLAVHPGGDLPVLHFVGRDATDEIEAYHPVEALARMKCFIIGTVDPVDWSESSGWKPLVPPVHIGWPNNIAAYAGVPTVDISLQAYNGACKEWVGLSPTGTTLPPMDPSSLEPPSPPPEICPVEQQRLSHSFRQLRHELLMEPGLFELHPWKLYRFTILRCLALFATFLWFYLTASHKWHYCVSAIALGFFMHQIMFCAHDAGHTEITGNRFWDRAIGGTIASFASGMSLGWWIDQHDVHHLITNHPEHDPDIQLLPFFAFNIRFFDSLYSTFHACVMHFDAPTRFLIQYQHLFFYPVMVFARFSLFGKSYVYLLTKAKADGFRTFELIGVVFFWCWYTLMLKHIGTGSDGVNGHSVIELWGTRVVFVLLNLIAVCLIHVQIVLSHSAQDSVDMGVYECFIHRQLRTTMDVSCPEYLDFIHGGLQMQIAHHVLIPRLSRPNHRRATVRIKQWCGGDLLEFKEKSFTQGNEEMVGMLEEIAGQCRALLATGKE
ncbi:fatty acid/sphingolipid desaturase [Gymnopus androsaceus JB14]|uniref:Delta 8-(E)-sphingolipid desaturase n=1 Tax=Gymnopus androsaceus JB14 TaxID=1447944 RepID=A0A6A4HWZ1_9AGAR|nr:fatty acid/sphingolipid desaturase [Gymnopus androsaceus JB14]